MGGGLFEKKVKKRIIKIISLKVKNKLARFKIIYKNMHCKNNAMLFLSCLSIYD